MSISCLTVRQWLTQAVLTGFFCGAVLIVWDWLFLPHESALTTIKLTTRTGQNVHFSPSTPATILYFWGSWCIYCRYTAPTIEALYRAGQPVVSVAWQSGDAAAVQNYQRQHHLTFPVVNDPTGAISHAFGIVATPTIAIVRGDKIALATRGWTSKIGLQLRLWAANLRHSAD